FNKGTMSIKGGVYKTASSDSSTEGMLIDNDGKLTISGGTFTTKTEEIIYNNSGAVLTIKDGTFTEKTAGDAAITGLGKVTIAGGTIKSPGLVIWGIQTLTIKGGTIISTKSATAIDAGSVLNLSGGTIESRGGSYVFNDGLGPIYGTVEVSGSSVMKMTGGSIYGKNVPAVRVGSKASFTQTGGTLKTGSGDIPTVCDIDYVNAHSTKEFIVWG
ncbi:MAG: hypothetical protein LIO94_04400, partial [Clostridiales bacterium]|nr:hypothetical protein [Clostridiales bacterium]